MWFLHMQFADAQIDAMEKYDVNQQTCYSMHYKTFIYTDNNDKKDSITMQSVLIEPTNSIIIRRFIIV